jgi:hypothetical protein
VISAIDAREASMGEERCELLSLERARIADVFADVLGAEDASLSVEAGDDAAKLVVRA